jgi:hypothetical protein
LQRRVIIDASEGVYDKASECLCCYGPDLIDYRYENYNTICPSCWTRHQQDTARLIELAFLARELAGADIGEYIVGHLLYFFCRKKLKEIP